MGEQESTCRNEMGRQWPTRVGAREVIWVVEWMEETKVDVVVDGDVSDRGTEYGIVQARPGPRLLGYGYGWRGGEGCRVTTG